MPMQADHLIAARDRLERAALDYADAIAQPRGALRPFYERVADLTSAARDLRAVMLKTAADQKAG